MRRFDFQSGAHALCVETRHRDTPAAVAIPPEAIRILPRADDLPRPAQVERPGNEDVTVADKLDAVCRAKAGDIVEAAAEPGTQQTDLERQALEPAWMVQEM